MRVTALTLYPVKSLEGVAVDARLRSMRAVSVATAAGASWMRPEARSRRVRSRAAGLSAEPAEQTGSGAIRLRDRAGGSIVVAAPREATPIVVDHSGQGTARPAGPEVHAWISERVGTELRLGVAGRRVAPTVRRDRGGPGRGHELRLVRRRSC